MKLQLTSIAQLLFYLLVFEFILVIVRPDNKPIIDLNIMKWVIIVTAVLFVSSIVYYLWRIKNEKV